jgi:Uma2 family endonuclease
MGLVATSGAYDYGYGPYTAEDLFALPDEGKSFELVDGWLIELSPSARHNFTANRLRRVIERAAGDAGAEAYVEAPMDISTPAGVRRPDVGVIAAETAATVRQLGISLYPGADLLLAVEVVSRGSGSEREDRGRKVHEYAQAGIRQYWVVDFDPRPRIQVRLLEGDRYGEPTTLGERDTLEVSDPFPICFKLSVLADFS